MKKRQTGFPGEYMSGAGVVAKAKKAVFQLLQCFRCNAEFVCEKLIWNDQLEMKGYLSVYDSACGTGTMLITFAHMLQKKGINPQTNALFVGQDVDRISALTCYIQLAILGLPAYVICRGYLVKFGKNSG